MKYLITIFLTLILAHNAQASFDDFDQIEGSSVIYAGKLERFECPIGGGYFKKYNCNTWPDNFYKLKDGETCISISSFGAGCSFGCSALIARKNGSLKVFTFNSGTVSSSTIETYKCPSLY